MPGMNRAGALSAYKAALKLNPGQLEIYRLIASVYKFQSNDDPLINEMRRVVSDTTIEPALLSQLHFALGKACADLGNVNEAFNNWEQGNILRRSLFDYRLEEDITQARGIISTFSEAFFKQREGFGLVGASPIFIVGMPRSGSTLVEQILSSHPAVSGAGETNEMNRIMKELGGQTSEIIAIKNQASQELAHRYLKRMSKYCHQDRPRFTDKQLFNFFLIGLIRLFFPDARVINCRRNPMATCFSIYSLYLTNLRSFAYDQYEIGCYYQIYEALMAHWHRTLPGYILDFKYEDLIENQEEETRKLLAFCNLEWQPSCLEFHNNASFAKTASFAQVRQPLNKSGTDRWRQYETHLAGIRRGLKRNIGL